ncbi:sigma-54 interaction domain-containing protein [Horticoccus luteus]|uniref:sigma-54 interaction domain-containing protein n=1 Tax=Horticoccus luteus TaxID=2862869 RepID=UPI0021066895|nr:sigma-54 dependent transcriptional regulator [Horticoccus luteus]
MKPVDVDRLQSILREQARSPESNRGAAALSPTPAPRGVQGSSKGQFTSQNPTVKRILETAWRVAPTTASVLLLGENGTGKTILAEAIHQRSNRAKEPFVTVNCPCLKRELLESELFGHVRGSFTGAISDAMGKVAAAEGGTLFLDEVGDLPLDIQPKLLRLLQDRVYERVGESRSRQANVRIIAATNRNLAAEVKAGRFREDLYYRLNVISLELPPLRERPEDILDAANHLLRSIGDDLHREFRGFTPLAGEALQSYDWPGNLRELRNVVERAAILSDRDILDLADFEIPTSTHAATPQVGSYVSLAKIEEEHIRQVIERTTTLEHAARILGIDKSTLYRKRKRQHSPLSDFEFANETAACAG